MLGLSRKPGEEVVIGDNIRVIVKEFRDGKVRLAIEAPPEVSIHRREVWDKIQRAGGKDRPKAA